MEKLKLTVGNVNGKIDFLKGMKIPFTVSVTNFTVKIESDIYSIHFLKHARNRRFFIAYERIKRNLNGMPLYVNDNLIRYFNIGNVYDNVYADKIYQVDISSCYISILYNDKLIDKKTYEYICKLPKEVRLASVGMLASKKHIFSFDSAGEIENYNTEQSSYSDYFFYCVQKTHKIMLEIKGLLGDDFLFSWVDAVYFKDENNAHKVMSFFKARYNLSSKFTEFNEFEIQLRKDYYHIRYIKDGKKSYMNIPCIETVERKEILNYLLTTKLKTYNVSKTNRATYTKE